jgi:hypothetical protein
MAQAAPAPFVIIMMENHGLHPVLNDQTDMPFLNSLWRGGSSLDLPVPSRPRRPGERPRNPGDLRGRAW